MELEVWQIERRFGHLRLPDRGRDAKLLGSMDAEGQIHPVLVAAGVEGRYVLIDGYRRLTVLEKLGQETVRAEILPGSVAEALLLHWQMETGSRRSGLEDALFLQELLSEHGFTQEELARRLRRSQSWVSRKLGMVQDLPELALDRVRDGRIPAYGAERYLVPMARATREHCSLLVEALGRRSVGTRDLKILYETWVKAEGDAAKRRVVSRPQLLLSVQKERRRLDNVLPDGGLQAALLGDLRALSGICRRLSDRLRKSSPEERARLDEKLLAESWTGVSRLFLALGELWKKEERDARRGQATDDLRPASRGARDPLDREGRGGLSQRGAADPGREEHGATETRP